MLRPARPGDIGFIRAIADAPENWDRLETYSQAQLQAALQDPNCDLWIWDAPQGPEAFAWLRRDGARVKLEEFGAAAPGRGSGRALMDALLAHLGERDDLSEFWLLVAADNDGAIRFYRRYGFQEGAVTPQSWHRRKGPVADALAMHLPLRDMG